MLRRTMDKVQEENFSERDMYTLLKAVSSTSWPYGPAVAQTYIPENLTDRDSAIHISAGAAGAASNKQEDAHVITGKTISKQLLQNNVSERNGGRQDKVPTGDENTDVTLSLDELDPHAMSVANYEHQLQQRKLPVESLWKLLRISARARLRATLASLEPVPHFTKPFRATVAYVQDICAAEHKALLVRCRPASAAKDGGVGSADSSRSRMKHALAAEGKNKALSRMLGGHISPYDFVITVWRTLRNVCSSGEQQQSQMVKILYAGTQQKDTAVTENGEHFAVTATKQAHRTVVESSHMTPTETGKRASLSLPSVYMTLGGKPGPAYLTTDNFAAALRSLLSVSEAYGLEGATSVKKHVGETHLVRNPTHDLLVMGLQLLCNVIVGNENTQRSLWDGYVAAERKSILARALSAVHGEDVQEVAQALLFNWTRSCSYFQRYILCNGHMLRQWLSCLPAVSNSLYHERRIQRLWTGLMASILFSQHGNCIEKIWIACLGHDGTRGISSPSTLLPRAATLPLTDLSGALQQCACCPASREIIVFMECLAAEVSRSECEELQLPTAPTISNCSDLVRHLNVLAKHGHLAKEKLLCSGRKGIEDKLRMRIAITILETLSATLSRWTGAPSFSRVVRQLLEIGVSSWCCLDDRGAQQSLQSDDNGAGDGEEDAAAKPAIHPSLFDVMWQILHVPIPPSRQKSISNKHVMIVVEKEEVQLLQLKSSALSLLAVLSHQNTVVQSTAGTRGLVELVLSHTLMHDSAPHLRERAIVATRCLTEDHRSNQSIIEALSAMKVSNPEELRKLGLEAVVVPGTGAGSTPRVRVKPLRPLPLR